MTRSPGIRFAFAIKHISRTELSQMAEVDKKDYRIQVPTDDRDDDYKPPSTAKAPVDLSKHAK